MRAIGTSDPYASPLPGSIVHTDRPDLNCRTAEQATLLLLATRGAWHFAVEDQGSGRTIVYSG